MASEGSTTTAAFSCHQSEHIQTVLLWYVVCLEARRREPQSRREKGSGRENIVESGVL